MPEEVLKEAVRRAFTRSKFCREGCTSPEHASSGAVAGAGAVLVWWVSGVGLVGALGLVGAGRGALGGPFRG